MVMPVDRESSLGYLEDRMLNISLGLQHELQFKFNAFDVKVQAFSTQKTTKKANLNSSLPQKSVCV